MATNSVTADVVGQLAASSFKEADELLLSTIKDKGWVRTAGWTAAPRSGYDGKWGIYYFWREHPTSTKSTKTWIPVSNGGIFATQQEATAAIIPFWVTKEKYRGSVVQREARDARMLAVDGPTEPSHDELPDERAAQQEMETDKPLPTLGPLPKFSKRRAEDPVTQQRQQRSRFFGENAATGLEQVFCRAKDAAEFLKRLVKAKRRPSKRRVEGWRRHKGSGSAANSVSYNT